MTITDLMSMWHTMSTPVFVLLVVAALGLFAVWWHLSSFKDPMTYIAYLKRREPGECNLDELKGKKFCVIGAGFCGLGVCAGLKRHGIKFDCLEATDAIGGNWSHGVYETVHIISSKKTTEYKDMPMPASYPDFPSRHEMLAYLNSYADHYKIKEAVQLNTAVKLVSPIEGSEEWQVELADGSKRRYYGVVVCNGHHWDTRMAGPYEGAYKFTGEVIHSKQYKKPESLVGKDVLVIGGGNSACDIAVEAGRFAKTSHVSLRHGVWFLPRVLFGKPAVEIVTPWMPLWLQRLLLRIALALSVGSYEEYGLPKPHDRIWDRHPTINTDLLNYCRLGRIKPHSDIKRFLGGKKVEFTDGSIAEFDLIVHATGYHVSLPLLAPGLVKWAPNPKLDDGRTYPDLINGLIHPTRKNLFVFGLGQPRYGAGPLITAGAEALALLIETQAKMKHPIGKLLSKIGGKPLANYVSDPYVVFTRTVGTMKAMKYFPTLERWLVRG